MKDNLDVNELKAQIKFNIIDGYSERINHLDSLNLFVKESYETILENHQDWFSMKDKRIGVYAIYISILYNSKTSLFLLQKFLKSEDWEDTYFSEILPKNKGKYYLFLKELDSDYRFLFFHQSFSQFESYIRSLYRVLEFKKGKDPFSLITKINPAYSDLITSIDIIRNTVHNNGYYFPIAKQPTSVVVKLNQEYKLEEGEQVSLTWDDAFFVFKEIIKCINEINRSELITKIENV